MADPKGHGRLKSHYNSADELDEVVCRYFDSLAPGELPTVAGLLLLLDVSRNTWAMWGRDPRYADVVEHARLRMQQVYERELVTRDRGSLQGLMFTLTNHFGWKNKAEVELGEETRATMALALPLSEKVAILQSAAMEFAKANAIDAVITADEYSLPEGLDDGAAEDEVMAIADRALKTVVPLPRLRKKAAGEAK